MTSATPETPDASPGLRPSLEAILLVADEPVPLVVLAQVLERPRNEVEAELRDLAASYVADGRGFDLREIAGGWRFYTREDCAPLVERFVSDGQEVRLTQAALETLAVVAYRQPVSRARRSEEHTSELQSQFHLVCRLLLEKKKKKQNEYRIRQ